MTTPLLVYDGSLPLFRCGADAVTRGTDIRPVRWESPPVQSFLEAQFGGRPFAFLLVEAETVHAGGETVGRVLRRRGLEGPLPDLLTRAYPSVAGPFGRVVHGREPADIGGSFELDPAAAAHLAPLREAVEIPVTDA